MGGTPWVDRTASTAAMGPSQVPRITQPRTGAGSAFAGSGAGAI